MGLLQALAPQREEEVEGEDEDQELVGGLQGQAGPSGGAAARRRAMDRYQMWGSKGQFRKAGSRQRRWWWATMTTSGMDAQMMDCLLQFFCYRVLDQLNRAQASCCCKSLPGRRGT